jgi:hypothetical protein
LSDGGSKYATHANWTTARVLSPAATSVSGAYGPPRVVLVSEILFVFCESVPVIISILNRQFVTALLLIAVLSLQPRSVLVVGSISRIS